MRDDRAATAPRIELGTIRRESLGAVLGEIAASGPRSRTTLARRLGFNPSTVSNLVSELVAYGLLEEMAEDENPGKVGRPAQLLRLRGWAFGAIGIEANVDYLAVCLRSLDGEVRHQERIDVDREERPLEETSAAVADLARRAFDHARQQSISVHEVTLALPGLVNAEAGRLEFAPNTGWRDLDAATLLADRFPNIAVGVDNEANLAVLAERWDGPLTARDTAICVTGSVGIGAGVLLHGSLLRGAHGFAGELGHVVVDPKGPLCRCGGKGCLETFAGKRALLGSSGAGSTSELRSLLCEGNQQAAAAVTAAGEALGIALASTIQLLDPRIVVVGGFLGPLLPWLAPAVTERANEQAAVAGRPISPVIASELGEWAAVRGAATHGLQRLLADPRLVGGPS